MMKKKAHKVDEEADIRCEVRNVFSVNNDVAIDVQHTNRLSK